VASVSMCACVQRDAVRILAFIKVRACEGAACRPSASICSVRARFLTACDALSACLTAVTPCGPRCGHSRTTAAPA
jgi:hypothetical protein